MALECTHIRFALDVKNKLKVKNLRPYIAGSIYPDSRYLTKTERNLTHDNKFIDKKFYNNNDFKKGWVSHLIYDIVQAKTLIKDFDDIIKIGNNKIQFGSDSWLVLTALKMIQDIDDFKKFKIQEYLDYLDYFETPNKEDINLMKGYNQMMLELYKNKQEISALDLCEMFSKLGYSDELNKKLASKMQDLLNDENIIKKIKTVYDKTIIKATNQFPIQ